MMLWTQSFEDRGTNQVFTIYAELGVQRETSSLLYSIWEETKYVTDREHETMIASFFEDRQKKHGAFYAVFQVMFSVAASDIEL